MDNRQSHTAARHSYNVYGIAEYVAGFKSLHIHFFGEWRSLVAYLAGGQGAAGSNPVSPTRTKMHGCDTLIQEVCFSSILK